MIPQQRKCKLTVNRIGSSSTFLKRSCSFNKFLPTASVLLVVQVIVTTQLQSIFVSSSGVPYEHGMATQNVVVLNIENMQTALQDPANPFWLLKFYAPWCGHCKKLAPVLEKVAKQTSGRMSIGTIDCTVEKKLCDTYKVRGYPTIKFSIDHDIYDYDGGRKEHDFINFSNKMMQPIIQSVSSIDGMIQRMTDSSEASSSSDSVVGFIFYDPTIVFNHQPGLSLEQTIITTPLGQYYNQLCRKLRALATSFYILQPSSDTELAEDSKAATMQDVYKTVGFHSTVDEVMHPFLCRIEVNVPPRCFDIITSIGNTVNIPSSLLQQSIDWIEKESIPTVSQLGPHNFHKLGRSGKPLVIAIIDEGNHEQVEMTKTIFTKYATVTGPEHIRNKYYYAHFDGNIWKNFLSQFNVFPQDLPQILVLDVPIHTYYQNATYKLNIDDFLLGIEDGSIPSKLSNDAGMNGRLVMLYRLIILYRPWSVVAIAIFLITIVIAIVLCLQPSKELSTTGKTTKTKVPVITKIEPPTTTIIEEKDDTAATAAAVTSDDTVTDAKKDQ